VGSALFEVISVLPEYGLTRADERLLSQYAEAIVERLPSPVLVTELGSGNGRKARWILEALCRRQRTVYCPVEISPTALARARQEAGALDQVSVVGFEEEYLQGLKGAVSHRSDGEAMLVLFLGSSIGNFGRDAGDAFLRSVRQALRPGDALLLGTDLVKDSSRLLLAYDDPLGVTAAFNLNLLTRINRELGADFDLSRFRHEARYDEVERRVEMHLRSNSDQTVTIPGAGLNVSFRPGETIWTESCYKYTLEDAFLMAERCGFSCEAQWADRNWPFAENLFVVV
jgi:dimethylhistidine N-methyltransferase